MGLAEMTERKKYLTIHGHFYQPPREQPWLEVVEKQDSAAPYHDWNERVTAECYAPNAFARILDEHGNIRQIVNNYSRISFNMGPTLLSWLRRLGARGTPIACRTRFDHVNEVDGMIVIDDIKSIADAHPDKIQRAIEEYGYDIQRHAYICAVEALRPDMIGRVKFRHWFISTGDPIIVVPVELDGQYAELGRVKWEHACDLWVECRKADRWPVFGDGKVIRLSPPHWVMSKHLGFEAAKSLNHLKG